MKRVLGGLGRWTWYLAAVVVVSSAALVSLGQYYFPYLDDYREEILARVQGRLPFGVELAGLHAEWTGLSPTFHVNGLRLYVLDDPSVTIFSAPRGEISIDLARSALALAPRLRRISAENVRLAFSEEPDGRWHVAGIGASRDPANREDILAFFLAIEEIALARTQIELYPAGGGRVETQDARVLLENYRSFRRLRLQAHDADAGARLELLVEASGDPRVPGGFEARAHATLQSMPLERLQPLAGSRALPRGTLSGELWARLGRDGRASAQGALQSPALALPLPADTPAAGPIEALDARFALDWGAGAGTLWLERLHGRWLDQDLALDRVRLDTLAQGDGRRYTLGADYLELGSLAAAVQASRVLVDPWAGVLADLSPYGGLADAHLDLALAPGQKPQFELRARLEDVSASPWKDAPGVRNVHGVVRAGADGGQVDIDTGAVTLEFPRLYREDLDFDRVRGNVYWRRDADGLEVGAERLQLASGASAFDAQFRLRYFRDPRREDEFSLAVGLRDADVALHRRFVPYVVSSELRQWLEGALRAGHVDSGMFALRLAFGRADGAHPLSLQMLLDAQGGSVGYHPDWPRVDGVRARLALDDKQIRVWADAGTVYDSRIDEALVEVDLAERPSRLRVAGRVHGDLSDGLQVIDTSPLANITRGALRDWRGDGALRVELGLDIPLGAPLVPETARIDVHAEVEGAGLQLVDYDLEVDALRGSIDYSLAHGLSSKALQGTLWGRPLGARIVADAADRGAFAVEVEGTAAVADLEQWLGLSGAAMLEGVAPFRLHIVQEGQGVLSRLESDLLGITSALPAPFAKPADTAVPLSITWWPVADGIAARAGLGDIAQLAVERDRGGAARGEAVVGTGAAPTAGGDGFRLRGELAAADAAAWIVAVPRLLKANAGAGADAPSGFRLDGLRLASAGLWTATLHDLRLDSRWEERDFVLDFAADAVAGEFRARADRAAPLELDIARLDLQPFLPAGETPALEAGPGWDMLRGAEIPRFDVEVGSARLGARDLGHWRFALGSTDGALAMTAVQAEMPGASIGPLADGSGASLRLAWADGSARTELAARMVLGDVGAFFDNWSQGRVLESRTGTGDFALHWPGGPTDFALASATGTMKLRFRDGRLLREGSNNPLMRAIGLLRFDELLRRMKFDFKDFYQKGLAFDRFDAPIAFADGVARADPMVELEGPTARMRIEGSSDLRAERIDASLTVTLPIGSNLPWVAALAGGLPVAAGVFVASRLFEDQIGKLSSAVYSVTGPLDDPTVEFQQVFDVEEGAPAAAVPSAATPQPVVPAVPAAGQAPAASPASPPDTTPAPGAGPDT